MRAIKLVAEKLVRKSLKELFMNYLNVDRSEIGIEKNFIYVCIKLYEIS